MTALKLLACLAVLGWAACLGASASADNISFSFTFINPPEPPLFTLSSSYSASASVPLAETDWASSVSITKFDPALGTLNSIEIELQAHMEGTAKFEHRGGSAATVTTYLSADLLVQRPDLSDLVGAWPTATTVDNVSGFDGTVDFGGTSGVTHAGLSADLTNSTLTSSAADLALFTGTGNIELPVVATAGSAATGSGNMLFDFTNLASADVKVTYNYAPVPEPSTLVGLVGMGLAGLALVWRRRRAK